VDRSHRYKEDFILWNKIRIEMDTPLKKKCRSFVIYILVPLNFSELEKNYVGFMRVNMLRKVYY